MRILKILAVVVAGLAVIFLWFAAYAVSPDMGYAKGYDTGHTEGHEEGYSVGYDIGHDVGQDKGYEEGYGKGYPEGYDAGHTEGYDTGYTGGYDAGYEKVSRRGEVFRNPTYQEMKEFLKADKTDAKQYVEGKYDCFNRAADINNNAEAQGIRSAWVLIVFPKGCYQIVAFETTDRGLIFIHFSDDKEVKVEVGVKYCEDNGYGKPDWDDTIKEVVITW